jgi:glucokinase
MKSIFSPDTSLFRILEEISRSPIVQPEALAEKIGLSLSTARSHIRTLRESRLVIPAGVDRKIQLNPDYGYLVGIDMGASHLHFALADFSGKMVSDTVEKVRPEDGPRKTILQIKKGVQRLIPRGKRKRLCAVGLAVPSAVDPRTGLVLMANNLPGWRNVSLKNALEKEFRVPVCIENDANMAAIGEHWRGVARSTGNFVFIALGTGIGSGIFVNGKLYVGRTGAAGELQFLNLEWPRWNQDFGDTGYFESHASGQGIATLGRKIMHSRSGARPGALAETRDAYFVFEAFHKGNKKARKVLETIFTILGVGIANVVGVLDPEMIVLGGGISKGAPHFMLSTVSRAAQRLQPNCPPILLSKLGDRAQTYGAIYSSLMAACKVAAMRSR